MVVKSMGIVMTFEYPGACSGGEAQVIEHQKGFEGSGQNSKNNEASPTYDTFIIPRVHLTHIPFYPLQSDSQWRP